MISDQFMNKTKTNLLCHPYGALTIKDGSTLYKLSGSCRYKTSGPLYQMAVRGVKKYAKNKSININCKGIVLMTVDDFEIVTI